MAVTASTATIAISSLISYVIEYLKSQSEIISKEEE
jgi:hypothetical protein